MMNLILIIIILVVAILLALFLYDVIKKMVFIVLIIALMLFIVFYFKVPLNLDLNKDVIEIHNPDLLNQMGAVPFNGSLNGNISNYIIYNEQILFVNNSTKIFSLNEKTNETIEFIDLNVSITEIYLINETLYANTSNGIFELKENI